MSYSIGQIIYVLSALDQHVGEKIFQYVIKTVVFITHALQYTSEADQIIVLKKGLIH